MTDRRPQADEVYDAFSGVDKEVLHDLYMADILEVQNWGNIVVTDNTSMFKFLMRRMFPEETPEIVDYDDRD